jgi:hypothetical protein
MNRRNFLGLTLAATGGIFVPQYGKWFRMGSGVLVPESSMATFIEPQYDLNEGMKRVYLDFRQYAFPIMKPLIQRSVRRSE